MVLEVKEYSNHIFIEIIAKNMFHIEMKKEITKFWFLKKKWIFDSHIVFQKIKDFSRFLKILEIFQKSRIFRFSKLQIYFSKISSFFRFSYFCSNISIVFVRFSIFEKKIYKTRFLKIRNFTTTSKLSFVTNSYSI